MLNAHTPRSIPRIAAGALTLMIVSVVAVAANAHASPAQSRVRTVHTTHAARDVVRAQSRSNIAADRAVFTAGTAALAPQESSPSPAVTPEPSVVDQQEPDPTQNNAPVEPVLVGLAVLLAVSVVAAIAGSAVVRRRRRAGASPPQR